LCNVSFDQPQHEIIVGWNSYAIDLLIELF
jgi:hypothetical protein